MPIIHVLPPIGQKRCQAYENMSTISGWAYKAIYPREGKSKEDIRI